MKFPCELFCIAIKTNSMCSDGNRWNNNAGEFRLVQILRIKMLTEKSYIFKYPYEEIYRVTLQTNILISSFYRRVSDKSENEHNMKHTAHDKP